MRVVCILLENSSHLQFIADTCLRYTPQIALGERWVFLEIGSCRKLYSEDILLLRLTALLKKFNISARIEVAGDMPTSLCQALFKTRRKESLPIEAISYFFDPFHTTNHLNKVIQVFRELGVLDFKRLLDLPLGLLTTKFNKDLNLVVRQIYDARSIYWPRYTPPEIIEERYAFSETHSVATLEPLLFVAKPLIEKILLRLRGQGFLLARFEIHISLEPYSTVTQPLRHQIIELAFPNNVLKGILNILRDRLEKELQKQPLESHVRGFSIRVLDKVPGGFSQKDFFSQKEEDQEAMSSLVSLLKEKLTDERVFYAQTLESYMPERSWQKTLNAVTATSTACAHRPLRILKSPIPLGRVDNYFIYKKQKWKIVSVSEPEKIAGEWWHQDSPREYQRVQTESGEELWIYLQENAHQYYLHGVFD